MGGELHVESTPGHGARFFFELTLPLARKSVAAQESVSVLHTAPRISKSAIWAPRIWPKVSRCTP